MGGFRAGAGQDTALVLIARSASPPSIGRVPIEGPQGRKNAHVKSAHLKVSKKGKNIQDCIYCMIPIWWKDTYIHIYI